MKHLFSICCYTYLSAILITVEIRYQWTITDTDKTHHLKSFSVLCVVLCRSSWTVLPEINSEISISGIQHIFTISSIPSITPSMLLFRNYYMCIWVSSEHLLEIFRNLFNDPIQLSSGTPLLILRQGLLQISPKFYEFHDC